MGEVALFTSLENRTENGEILYFVRFIWSGRGHCGQQCYVVSCRATESDAVSC